MKIVIYGDMKKLSLMVPAIEPPDFSRIEREREERRIAIAMCFSSLEKTE